MSAHELIAFSQWLFIGYFALLNAGYLLLNVNALIELRGFFSIRGVSPIPAIYTEYEMPITVLMPAYNEAATIIASVRALEQLRYPRYEIIVINDGSSDATLEALRAAFALQPFPEAYRDRLASAPIRQVYRSTSDPGLRVIDKHNGGKADALNAGINAARYPLFCSVDADSVLQPDSLSRVLQPFLDDPRTVAARGTVRIANGCRVHDGFLTGVGLPRSPLALLQIVEYLRAFLFGRLGWSPMNALLIISGAFGLFRKEVVIEAGGYRTDTVGEDMELVVRLHRTLSRARRPYRITFVPDPICWTEAPEDLRTLARQRIRWQRGLAESLLMNPGLCCHPRSGAAGWFAYPFTLVFELFGPLLEVSGYVFMIAGALQGWIALDALLAFLLLAVGLGVVLSTSALLLEELSFHVYPGLRSTLALFAVAVLENFGYRQLNALWRLIGLARWATRRRASWGEMRRRGA